MTQVTSVHTRYALNQDVLYVAARAPRPGYTKSRLGRTIGYDRAAALYAAFVQDLAARLRQAPFRVGWYITPDDAWTELGPLMPARSLAPAESATVLFQPPGSWAERQHQLFATASMRHERRTVLIASDSPHLPLEWIVEAFERLNRDDLVLGPTEDGGYYLVGMRTPATSITVRPWEVLTGVRMSTGAVLSEILARATALGLQVGLLPTTFDIDEAADLARLLPLARLSDGLTATHTALRTLGLIPEQLRPDEESVSVAVGGAR